VKCDCHSIKENLNEQIRSKFNEMEQDLVAHARRMVKTASDPFSGVIKFLHERPDNASLHGYVVDRVLVETFGSKEEIPGLLRAIGSHVREVVRQADVIKVINEHPTAERWGNYIIKQKESMRFEIGVERGNLVLKNISGLFGMEHGVELPLEKIEVKPPKLIVTLNMGLLRPQRVLDI
jgi:hypothetical protein